MLLFSHSAPGGFHLGILPAAGLREAAGLRVAACFDVQPVEDDAGLLEAGLAVGGVVTGVEAAVRRNSTHSNVKL